MTVLLFILIAFMVIYPITSSLWHLRKLRQRRSGMITRSLARHRIERAHKYQRYLRSHNGWINRMYHEMFNEKAEERTLDGFERP